MNDTTDIEREDELFYSFGEQDVQVTEKTGLPAIVVKYTEDAVKASNYNYIPSSLSFFVILGQICKDMIAIPSGVNIDDSRIQFAWLQTSGTGKSTLTNWYIPIIREAFERVNTQYGTQMNIFETTDYTDAALIGSYERRTEEVVDETVTSNSFLPSGVGSFYNQRPVYPGQRNIHEGFGTADVSSTFEPPERTGIMENLKNKLSGFTTPTLEFLKKIGGGKRSAENQAFYDAVTGGKSLASNAYATGDYKGNQYGIYNSPSGLKVGSDIIGWGEGYEKNFDSRFGSKSLEEMEQKKIDWAMNRLQNKKAISQRLGDVLTARGLIGGDQRPDRTITDTVTDRVTDVVQPGKGGEPSRPAYTGPKTFSYDPGLARAMGGQRATKSGGFTDPGRGSYGPHSRAEGGRIGYQEGELVEDEYMAEATPGGMMEENIEEVQGEPSREQLEAIALEIFRLPLEELNEEQLNVVYQAAMEQEPAEEEVQFAAQEGPGEGIASLV